MTPDERQAQIDFMNGQKLAMEMQRLFAGYTVSAVANAISLTFSTFCHTCGADPVAAFRTIARASEIHFHEFDASPPVKTDVN